MGNITICGITYKSIADAARKNGIDQGTLQYRLRTGMPEEDLFAPVYGPFKQSIEINGVTYESLNDAARRNGLEPGTVHARFQKGVRGEALIAPARKMSPKGPRRFINGMTVKELSEATGIPVGTLNYRYYHETPDCDMTKISTSTIFEADGIIYDSFVDFGRKHFSTEEDASKFAKTARAIRSKSKSKISKSDAAIIALEKMRGEDKISTGELAVKNDLLARKIPFMREVYMSKLIPDLTDQRLAEMRVDFVLYRKGAPVACVEYDGEQHFHLVKSWAGGIDGFRTRVRRDKDKTGLVRQAGLPLLRIRYDQDPEQMIRMFLDCGMKMKGVNPLLSDEDYWADVNLQTDIVEAERKGIVGLENRTDHLGNVYPSKRAMCNAYGVHPNTYDKRRNKLHMSVEEALTHSKIKSKHQISYNGVVYDSASDLARANGMKPQLVIDRLTRGMSVEDAIKKTASELRAEKNYKGHRSYNGPVQGPDGAWYHSEKALFEAYDVDRTCVRNRMYKGMSRNDAILDILKKRENNG